MRQRDVILYHGESYEQTLNPEPYQGQVKSGRMLRRIKGRGNLLRLAVLSREKGLGIEVECYGFRVFRVQDTRASTFCSLRCCKVRPEIL